MPGEGVLILEEAVFDLNGTLAHDGRVSPEVRLAIRKLKEKITVTVLTAGTFGRLDQVEADLGIRLQRIQTGDEKGDYVQGRSGIVAVGNGKNDVAMFEAATLAICVMGPEGCSVEAFRAAHILVRSPVDAIGLLLEPRRITATLRA